MLWSCLLFCYKYSAVNNSNVSNGSFTSSKSNVADFDFLKTENWMNFTSHSQTSNFFFLSNRVHLFLNIL